jgi:hypothetical protein
MVISGELAIGSKLPQGLLLPDGVVIVNVIGHIRLEHKESTVDPTAITLGFFLETLYRRLSAKC